MIPPELLASGKMKSIGISWYTRESYAGLRAMMADADVLPDTYEKFLYRAQKQEEKFRRAGLSVIRVHLDTNDFPAFCRARGLNLDASARGQYAAAVAGQMISSDPRGNA